MTHLEEVVATARNLDIATRANTAAAIALRLYPGVAGQVLAGECRTVAEFPWLGANPQALTVRLIDELLAMDVPMEETA